MNKIRLCALIVGLFTIAAAIPARAEAPAKPACEHGMWGHGKHRQDLNLTDDQKTKLEEVFKKQGEKMRELRQDQSLSREDRRAKMQKIQEDSDPDIKKILTPDQYTQYKKLQEQRRQGGRGNRPAPAPAPQQ